jgi:hypothetical protein
MELHALAPASPASRIRRIRYVLIESAGFNAALNL